MPERIQRKRTKGYRMPEGAIYVGRPTKWGNPWAITEPDATEDFWVVEATQPKGDFVVRVSWLWDGPLYFDSPEGAVAFAVAMYRAWVILLVVHGDVDLSDLRGKDLADWCALDQPCHADVLLELANQWFADSFPEDVLGEDDND